MAGMDEYAAQGAGGALKLWHGGIGGGKACMGRGVGGGLQITAVGGSVVLGGKLNTLSEGGGGVVTEL